MAIYAIGDLQGCHDEFRTLLDKLRFDPERDQLWLVGDLVNRGPKSLECLRYVKSIGPAVTAVLGNHDLHLLALAEGVGSTNDASMQAILNAADAAELLDWLRQRPLLHYDADLDYCMVHAGIYPGWTLSEAQQYARELETVLRGDDYHTFFQNMYGDQPTLWAEQLAGRDRLRFICNAFTRMRFCQSDGSLELKAKGGPGAPPNDCYPWYDLPQRVGIDTTILFGHWAALGLHIAGNVHSLDTGCVWGGQLTAYQLGQPADRHITTRCPQNCPPGTP
ncbi:symmetrical bis(5'-nucleosyl)-tetraphosphatase [Thiohalophilus sp.]|uniref:symmetrical bis(5'-nucleosyl)-tetraphosphatase n=1 Tax=Thiohalophilus sp. TaxID=3028392 RepID=UPI002ACEC6B0|nr:symmetrical bis(5'-nucleosyl)-tetraphosphatase [Thiohalophilus sp.]MDZ7662011.1 symmetrical bis(5'-nucleosyl)-tetraphosphatase [Thiohalophilus sp.]